MYFKWCNIFGHYNVNVFSRKKMMFESCCTSCNYMLNKLTLHIQVDQWVKGNKSKQPFIFSPFFALFVCLFFWLNTILGAKLTYLFTIRVVLYVTDFFTINHIASSIALFWSSITYKILSKKFTYGRNYRNIINCTF